MAAPRQDRPAMEELAQVYSKRNLRSWLQQWRDDELSKLPLTYEHTAVLQGRCQVLNEFIKLIDEAPDVLASAIASQKKSQTQ